MKTRFLTFCFLLSAFCFPVCGGTFHCQWLFRDAASNTIAIKQVTLQPIAAYGVDGSTLIITGDRRTFQSDAAGSVIASNLFNGRSYRVQVTGPNFQTTFTNSFDTNVTGLVNGADPLYLSAPIRDTGVVAYSQAAADARFHQVAGDTSTNAVFRGTLKIPAGATVGYVFTVTNSDGSGAWQAATSAGSTSNFLAGQNTIWATVGGSNQVSVTGTLTNNTTGNAATATFALGGYGIFGGNAGGFTNSPHTPPQLPSTIWNSWSSGTLLLTNGNSIQDSNHLAEATIGNIGTTMALYYSSYDGGTTGRIWAAYGSLKDGFVKHGVVLEPTAGTWDRSSIGGATHYRENGTNYLYYFGGTNFGAFEADPLSIGMAYSTDGTNYTKYAGNPILTPSTVGGSALTLYTFFPKKVGTNYLGYFNVKHTSGVQERIHLVTAPSAFGPWTYYGEIYHHTNATITSDFTVADLPSGGYIGAYWMVTNGSFSTACAYSENLINWRHAGTLNGTSPVGTRLFWDDGLALSYCVNQSAVYYARPKRSNLGVVVAETIISTGGFVGDGTAVTNVYASTALNLRSRYGSGQTVLGGTFDDDDLYWVTWGSSDLAPTNHYSLGYRLSGDHWFTHGGFQFGDFISLTNHTGGTNAAMITKSGSRINGVGITNNVITADGSGLTNLPVSGLNTNGGTPGQVATAQANGTVTWSNAPAGSGTSVTFDSTQFGSASGGTNIKSGVLLTNAVNRIADETIFVTDSSGAGNPLLSWDSDNGDIRVHANLVVRDGFYGHGGNLTNLNASELTSGTVPDARISNTFWKTNEINRVFVATNSTAVGPEFTVVNANKFAQTNATRYVNITNGAITASGAITGGSLASAAGVTGTSITSAGHLTSGAGSRHEFSGRTGLASPASGMVSMFNLSDFYYFDRLILGGGTSVASITNFPALVVLTTNNTAAGSVLGFMNGTNRVSGSFAGLTRTVDIVSGGHEIATNSAPQSAAWTPGGMFFWNSNGSGLYVLRSGPNSTTWTSTNVLLAP